MFQFICITILFYTSSSSKSTKRFSNTKYTLQANSNNTSQFNSVCVNNSSCSNNGYCLNSTHCKCLEGYTTLKNQEQNPDFYQCSYYQKNKKIAFLLSFFLGPLSFDHFYLGNNTLGYCKLFIPCFFIILGVSIFIMGKTKASANAKVIGKSIEFIATILIIFWWLIDWILILSNYYTDLNNVKIF